MRGPHRDGLNVLLWILLALGILVVLATALAGRFRELPPVGGQAGPADHSPHAPRVWDFTRDFVRDHSAARNPSVVRDGRGGAWRYMAVDAEGSRDLLAFKLLDTYRQSLQGTAGFDAWLGDEEPVAGVSFPIVGVKGADPASAAGFAHPSSRRRAIIAWRSPDRLTVRLSGEVTDQDDRAGDGVSWALRKGVDTLARGRLKNDGARQTFSVGGVAVAPGDSCYLMIAARANSGYDSTGVSLRIEEARATTGGGT